MPQLVQSFRQLPISLIVNLANGLILAAVLWNAVPTPVLLTWSGLLIAVTGARFLTLRAFRNAAPRSESDHAYWTKYFLAGACAAGVVWGLSGILLFHPTSFQHQVVLAFVLGGMVAGAVPLLSSVSHAYWCFAIPVVAPISIRMMWEGDRIHLIMGLMMVIFGLAMLATSAQVHRLFRDSEKLRRELFSSIEVEQALEYLARLDSLTGIPNRRLFEEELSKEWARAKRDDEPLSLIMVDIDHFKEYNDHYGHPAGDLCLVEVAQAMHHALSRRVEEAVARPERTDFDFIPAGSVPENPSELLGSAAFSQLVSVLRDEYDLIMIDSAVLLAVPDALLLAANADGTLLVHKPGSVDRHALRRIREDLVRARARVLGIVFNQVDPGSSLHYPTYMYSPYTQAEPRDDGSTPSGS